MKSSTTKLYVLLVFPKATAASAEFLPKPEQGCEGGKAGPWITLTSYALSQLSGLLCPRQMEKTSVVLKSLQGKQSLAIISRGILELNKGSFKLIQKKSFSLTAVGNAGSCKLNVLSAGSPDKQ